MASDDWRIRIELKHRGDEGEQGDFLERLRGGLDDEAKELAKALRGDHLVATGDANELFVYASSRTQAERAEAVIAAEFKRHGFEAEVSRVEHWLKDEERWDDEPPEETWEEEMVDRGDAPWEVRVSCSSHREAGELANRLEGDGYRPVRRWRYLIVGTNTREDAEALARRLHGEVELGGEVVWEEANAAGVISPFRLFG